MQLGHSMGRILAPVQYFELMWLAQKSIDYKKFFCCGFWCYLCSRWSWLSFFHLKSTVPNDKDPRWRFVNSNQKVSAWNHAGDLKKLSQNCAVCAAIASLVTALRCGCYGGGCPKGLSEYRAGRRIKKNHYSDCLRLIINILYYTILYYIIIYYIILHYSLYYIILSYIILYYYVISYHVILYYINEFSHLLLDFGPCVSWWCHLLG